jgi:hypothetical protein
MGSMGLVARGRGPRASKLTIANFSIDTSTVWAATLVPSLTAVSGSCTAQSVVSGANISCAEFTRAKGADSLFKN